MQRLLEKSCNFVNGLYCNKPLRAVSFGMVPGFRDHFAVLPGSLFWNVAGLTSIDLAQPFDNQHRVILKRVIMTF